VKEKTSKKGRMGNRNVANRYITIKGDSYIDVTIDEDDGVNGFAKYILSYRRKAQGGVRQDTLEVQWRSKEAGVDEWSDWYTLETVSRADKGRFATKNFELAVSKTDMSNIDEVQLRFQSIPDDDNTSKKNGFDVDQIILVGRD